MLVNSRVMCVTAPTPSALATIVVSEKTPRFLSLMKKANVRYQVTRRKGGKGLAVPVSRLGLRRGSQSGFA